MANICSFSMYVKGNAEDIVSFYNAMCQNGNVYMGRGAEAELNLDAEDNSAMIDGWCKWSIQSSLIDNAISMRTNPERWWFGDGFDVSKIEFITLPEACKKWNLEMEVYSEEPGCCFQEHYMFTNGEDWLDECVDYYEYYLDEFETKEEAERELEVILTDEEWSDGGYISRGGFGEWEFEI